MGTGRQIDARLAWRRNSQWGYWDTDLQLLHPVLTFGLLVLARRCLGTPFAEFRDDTEVMTVGVGEGA